MQKRGQVTIFIILGIIIVISMGLLFAANIGDEFSSTILESTAIKNSIISCLEKATNDGLELIGKQGGKLNVNDGVSYENYKVPYGIKKSETDNSHPSGERYPYAGKLIKNPDELTIKNYFGNYVTGFDDHLSFLTPLCSYKESSPNWAWNVVKKSCETYGFSGNSVQDYLQKYIIKEMENCKVEYPGYDIKLYEEKIEIKVVIGEDDLIVNLEYPIEISINGKTKTKLLKYSINPKVRLKKIHEFASHLIGWQDIGRGILPRGDVTNLFFNMLTDYKKDIGCRKNKISKVSCWKEGMKIEKLYNIHGADDIFRIIDEKSIVNGKPFIFQFAIENRRPALDYINKIEANLNYEITITAKGYDPDDGDVLKYKWYLDGIKQSETSNVFEYVVGSEELTVEVCDNANTCDSQPIEIQE